MCAMCVGSGGIFGRAGGWLWLDLGGSRWFQVVGRLGGWEIGWVCGLPESTCLSDMQKQEN